jgi:flagellar protein FlgJ
MSVAVESLASDVRGAEALRAKATSGDPEALRAAAKQFEAMFLQIMLKTMRETRFSTEDDPFANSGSLKLYQELLDQQWAQKMSSGRGLGFAEAMYTALSRQGTSRVASPETAVDSSGATNGTTASDPATTPAMPTTPSVSRLDTARQAFIDGLRPYAEKTATDLGLPAEFILAQAALETGWGKRRILGEDGSDSFNLFGIKAGAKWTGGVVEQTTTEYVRGLAVKATESFRAYDNFEAAFGDYADLLRRRYPLAAAAGDDVSAFASGLAAGGYATDPAYADKIRRVVASLV